MLLLCIGSDVMPQTVAGALSLTSLEDTGGMRLNNFPDRKEANHGGDSSVVDEGWWLSGNFRGSQLPDFLGK
jgi:hypothetical protein